MSRRRPSPTPVEVAPASAPASAKPPEEPLPLGAPQAAALYDQLLHAQVLACVDVDGLCQLQQLTVLHVSSLGDLDDREASELAATLIDRSLARLPNDLRCFLSMTAE